MSTESSNSAYAPKENAANKEKANKKADSRELEAAEIDLAVAELRYQTAFYQEAVKAMMDGVSLGAQQVQDKRIEFLEVGTTTETGSVIFAIVLTFILEGTVGPAIASLATRALLAPIFINASRAINIVNARKQLKTIQEKRKEAASLYKTVMWDETFTGSRTNLIIQAQELKAAANALSKDLRKNIGSTKPIRKTLSNILDFAEHNLNAVAKTPAAAYSVPGGPIPLSKGNSPGVEITTAAMASASKLRLAIVATHESLELDIKKPGSTAENVGKILNESRVKTPVDFGSLRHSYALATEAMIWAHLLISDDIKESINQRNNMPWSARDIKDPSLRGINAMPINTKIDKKLEKYLLIRFAAELERWATEFDAPTLTDLKNLSRSPRPTGWWQGLPEVERIDILIQYLANVENAIPAGELILR